MNHNIAIVQEDPAVLRLAFGQGGFMEFSFNLTGNGVCQALNHPAACAVDQDKVICK